MISLVIIEVDDGLTIVEISPGESAAEAALAAGGVLVDAGPFHSYEEANDALDQLEPENQERAQD